MQHGGLKALGQPRGVPQVRPVEPVHPAGHDPREQPVVRDAVHRDGLAPVDGASGDREPDPGADVRVHAREPLGERDLLRADRVPGTGRRQRVGDDMKDPGGAARVAGRGSNLSHSAGGGPVLRVPPWGGYGGAKPSHARGVQGGRPPARKSTRLKHRYLGEEGPAEAGRAPAARALEFLDRVGEASLTVGEPGGEPGTGPVVLRQPRERGPRDSRLVNGEAERGEPGRRRFKRGERATAVPRAPQRGGPAVRPGEPDQAAQRCGQRPPGERHRAHRVVGHVSQHHGCGEHDRSRSRRYSHAGRY